MVCDRVVGSMESKSSQSIKLIRENVNLNKIEWFEDILASIGNRGRFQNRMISFVLVSCALVWLATQNQLFALYVPDHWCHVPGRELTNFTLEEWKNLQIPREHGRYSKCKMFSVREIGKSVDCEHGWDYDDTWFSVTIPSEQNWVCEKKLYMNNTFSITQGLAIFFVMLVCYTGDRYGRRFQFGLSVALVSVCRTVGTFFPSIYVLYLALLTLGSSGNASSNVCIKSLGVELVDSGSRSFVNLFSLIAGVCGKILCAFIASWTRNYLHMMLATTLPLFLVLCCVRWVPESPRWLISKGRYKEAHTILEQIAKVNGNKLPPETLDVLERMSDRRSKNFGILDLIKNRNLRYNTLFLVASRFVTTLNTTSLSYNINNIPLNPFLIHIVFALVEIPALTLAHFSSEKIGRRWSHVVFMLLQVITSASLVLLLTASSSTVAEACLAVVLNMMGLSARAVATLQSMEVHPTCVRQTSGALEMVSMNVAMVVAPYVVFFRTEMDGRVLYGSLGILQFVTAIIVCYLPETLNRKLPETLEDADNLGTSKNFWSSSQKKKPCQSTKLVT